jgi:hypothetical protein
LVQLGGPSQLEKLKNQYLLPLYVKAIKREKERLAAKYFSHEGLKNQDQEKISSSYKRTMYSYRRVIKITWTTWKKYFDYNGVWPDCSDNSEKNTSTTLSSTSSTAASTTACHARGLDINSLLSAEAHTQDLQFRRHQQRGDPNNARGLDNNFASDRDYDSTTTTRLRHHRLCHADHAASDKS